jgi:hypothetical protein
MTQVIFEPTRQSRACFLLRQNVVMEANVLAIVAIVMSAASLAWQAASWLWSGAVIRAWFVTDSDRLIVTAYNSGRVAATITAITVRTDLGPEVTIDSTPLADSDPIPFRIAEGSHGSWQFKVTHNAYKRAIISRYRGASSEGGGKYFKHHVYAKVTVGRNRPVYADPASQLDGL